MNLHDLGTLTLITVAMSLLFIWLVAWGSRL